MHVCTLTSVCRYPIIFPELGQTKEAQELYFLPVVCTKSCVAVTVSPVTAGQALAGPMEV